jgi:phosphonate transport system permease protein
MNATERRNEWQRFALWGAIALSVVVAGEYVGAEPGKLADREGLANALGVLAGFAHPDVSPDFLARIGWLSIESLLIGVLGTLLAVVIGGALALITIRVPDLLHPPKHAPRVQRFGFESVRMLGRWVLGFFRSIPEIIWAYLFVRLFGLGVLPAILAIGLAVGGSIGKLYSELAEAVDPRAVRALRAMGASRISILVFSVLPQVGRQWIAYALFRLECNIRTGTILGVVGAGGLGSEIALSVRYFEYDKLATALLAVLLFVVALELLSAWLRRSPTRYTLVAAALGGTAALWFLELPWRDLLAPSGATLTSTGFGPLQWDFIRTAAVQVSDTLAMAWIATCISAVIAFVLAPLAAAPLTTRSYLQHAVTASGVARLLKHACKWASRSILQVTRAMPELTLALVFVVWVGVGPLAGILAIAVHNAGVLGRLYSDVLEEVEPGPPAALQAMGAGSLGTFLFGVLPQVRARIAAFTLYRFEVNVRATAMVGFVGAGGIGDALHTAISLFHLQDLVLLLITMVALVTVVDTVGDRVRARILQSDHGFQPDRIFMGDATAALSASSAVFPDQPPVLVTIDRVMEATGERLIVQTALPVPEHQRLRLAPLGHDPMGSTYSALVTARRVPNTAAAEFVYELMICGATGAAQQLPSLKAKTWHLQTQPLPLDAVPQST